MGRSQSFADVHVRCGMFRDVSRVGRAPLSLAHEHGVGGGFQAVNTHTPVADTVELKYKEDIQLCSLFPCSFWNFPTSRKIILYIDLPLFQPIARTVPVAQREATHTSGPGAGCFGILSIVATASRLCVHMQQERGEARCRWPMAMRRARECAPPPSPAPSFELVKRRRELGSFANTGARVA